MAIAPNRKHYIKEPSRIYGKRIAYIRAPDDIVYLVPFDADSSARKGKWTLRCMQEDDKEIRSIHLSDHQINNLLKGKRITMNAIDIYYKRYRVVSMLIA